MAFNQVPVFPATSHFSAINSPYPTTPLNPPRNDGSFDYIRCAALHNEILSKGWSASGRKSEVMPHRNWFAYHGAEAEAMRSRLSPDLISFMERAIQVGDDDSFSFFYYVNGLRYPDILWINHEDGGDGDRFITLYSSNLDSKPYGLIFDQQENKAIMSMSVLDQPFSQQWYPLETVLSAWLDMIEMGKIKAVTEEIGDDNKKDPWINVPYSELQLQETLDVYNKLVDTIIAAMPENFASQPSSERPLLDDTTLDEAKVPFGFAREFLSKAKSTPFRFIAPGLSLPNAETFISQPFSSITSDGEEDEESRVINPILLFRSASLYSAPPNDNDPSGSDLPFGWPFNQVSSYPAGLYLSDVDRGDGNIFEDETKFVLPFSIGGDSGFARKSDGSRIRGGGQGQLYQPGYQPFVDMHGVRLVSILRSWIGMVERGDWKVGPEGVLGDVEMFREADTEDGWEKYVLPISW